ncbi:MAG: flagellar biosynthesis protein FlhF [Phycisphaerales bacterium]|nr:flagellar biosynthesis protein FlhF [Phycisphaerales bacterium]
MNQTIKTYQGSSISDAVAKVKQDLGPAAVILHTRSFKRGGLLGLGAKNVVEITATPRKQNQSRDRKGATAASRSTGRQPGGSSSQSNTALLDAHHPRNPLHNLYNASRPAGNTQEDTPIENQKSKIENTLNPSTRELAASVIKTPAFELRNELSSLRTMVESLLQRTASNSPRRDLPQQLAPLYTQLIQQQVSDEIAARVVDDVKAELTPEQLTSNSLVRERLTQKLEQMLPANLQLPVARPTTGAGGGGEGCRSICLIGPTGVGKTTTIAKLAAHFKLRQKQKVGLITIDTYRIAAVDQLRTYANIIGVPLKVVLTPRELVAALMEMSNFDTVLIDTAGRSHGDQLKLNELAEFIAVGKPSEVHLVLSSTTTQEVMEAALDTFGQLRVHNDGNGGGNRIIFTKLDEAVSFGILLNVARAASRCLSYITTGQDVPDNIEVGQPRRLARLILGEKL